MGSLVLGYKGSLLSIIGRKVIMSGYQWSMGSFSGRALGYARVSTEEQHLDLQVDALQDAGCIRVYSDQGISAVSKYRKGFEEVLVLRVGYKAWLEAGLPVERSP